MQEHHDFLRVAFKEAMRAREHGNHPFGAVLVNADGEAILAAENSVITQKDVSAHAEINLLRAATRKLSADELSHCSVYASSEPCPMCASAMVWANTRKLVFGLGMEKLYMTFGDTGDAPVLKVGSREIFKYAPWPVTVTGPLLEDEALRVHEGFW